MRKIMQTPVVISKAAVYLCAAILAVMCIHITSEVISRALFNYPYVGTIEIVSFHYMIAVSFLPLGYVQLAKANITVDILSSVLSKRAQFFVDLFANLVTLVVVGGLIVASAEMAIQQTSRMEAVRSDPYEIWIWPSRWFLVIGFVSMALVLAGQIVKSFISPEMAIKLGLDAYELPKDPEELV